MATTAFLPVGTEKDQKRRKITKGDIVKLVTGEEVVFLEMKHTKWNGLLNGKGIIVPMYRDMIQSKPFIIAIVGKDKSVIAKYVSPEKLKVGDLFFIEGSKESFMFFGNKTKKGGRPVIMGKDLASGRVYTIDVNMKIVKIDINKLKKTANTIN